VKPAGYHTEAELVAALNAGDKKAFEIIYRKYAPELFRYIQRNITRYEDCEEVLQDIFEWIWKKHTEKNIKSSLKAYLFAMTNNRVLSYFRVNKAKRNYEKHFLLFEAVFEYALDQEDKTIDPEALQSFLQNSIQKLPARCREAFTLRLENLSNAEIAQQMNLKKDTVENYLVRALSHLRESYQSISQA
jgi:RNA polymerase sigma-70 factor (family 1)